MTRSFLITTEVSRKFLFNLRLGQLGLNVADVHYWQIMGSLEMRCNVSGFQTSLVYTRAETAQTLELSSAAGKDK